MKVQVLGGHGGLALGFNTTSFLIDGKLLLDAGAVASTLTIDQQVNIDHILITHCHLDHIKDLAFICDNCFGMKKESFHVHTHMTVKKMIQEHLLNDIVWPDFTKLPNREHPTMKIHSLQSEVKTVIGDYGVTPVKVNHAHDAMGFIIEKDEVALLFTGDTGPTEKIWERGKEIQNLKGIFTEVSFPNKLQNIADLSDHHTPWSMHKEMAKMPKDIPVILTHLKPNFKTEILLELKNLKESRLRVLEHDGMIFSF